MHTLNKNIYSDSTVECLLQLSVMWYSLHKQLLANVHKYIHKYILTIIHTPHTH